jgi:hypothetical protein
MSSFFALFAILIQYPAAALVPAALFAIGFALKRGPLAALSCVLWVLYCGYEFLMKFRLLCSGECNIRVDLLILYPALFLVSIAGIVEFLVRQNKVRDGAA